MKKLLTVLFALAMTVSMSSFVVAQEGGASGKETKKTEKKEKKASKKGAKKDKKEKKADSQ